MRHKHESKLEFQYVRELKHSTDVRTVFLNNKIMVTTDDLKDIYLWDLELPSGDSSDSSYQRQRNTCIRSLTGVLLFVFICKLCYKIQMFPGHNGPVHSIHCEKGILLSCDTTGVVSEKDFWCCVVEGPGKVTLTTFCL